MRKHVDRTARRRRGYERTKREKHREERERTSCFVSGNSY